MHVSLFILMIIQSVSFKDTQLQFGRVKVSYEEKEEAVKQHFRLKNLSYKDHNLFLRAFKAEQTLEVWVKEVQSEQFTLVRTYAFCTNSGTLGPKRKEGDLQIPEGVYYINHFNPESKFYLSLGLNYPNASDKILSDKQHPGGSIYIHGNCVTIGCIPITDDKIKELYILAVEAKNNGQEKIPVHIFPTRLTDQGLMKLRNDYPGSGNIPFWENLKIVFDGFEHSKTLKPIRVNKSGQYVF